MKTEIEPTSSWPNYVWQLDLDIFETSKLLRKNVLELYEMGKMVVLDNFVDRETLDWFKRIRFPWGCTPNRKKTKIKAIMGGTELTQVEGIKDRTAALVDAVDGFVAKVFGSYGEPSNVSHTLRFSETRDEGLHFDTYTDKPQFVRVFVNLDTKPRSWRLGPQIWDAMKFYGKLFRIHDDMSAGEVASAFAKWYLKRRQIEIPRHKIELAPGALWCGNSQVISHQVVAGNAMGAFSYAYPVDRMQNPTLHFREQVKRCWSHDSTKTGP